MTKEESRGKLIRELQDLGQFIAPTDQEAPAEGVPVSNDASPVNLTDPLDDGSTTPEEHDFSDRPTTVDMFVPESASTEKKPRSENDRQLAKTEKGDIEVPGDSKSNASLTPEIPERLGSEYENARDSGDHLDELVDELVSAVEKRLSLQSGESLPESLRDELSRDIRDRLSPWWSET